MKINTGPKVNDTHLFSSMFPSICWPRKWLNVNKSSNKVIAKIHSVKHTCLVVRPLVGDPGYANNEFWLLKKTLYGLRRSPHHWYNMFTNILSKLGLIASPQNLCIYTGVINPWSNYDPTTSDCKLLHIGIYVDDFVYFSEDPAEEKLFQEALASRIKVDFWVT